MDESDDDILVNIVINVEEGYVHILILVNSLCLLVSRSIDAADKPYKAASAERPEIPRKPTKSAPASGATNGDSQQNGQPAPGADVQMESGPKGTKRPNAEEDDQPAKKARTSGEQAGEVVLVEDDSGAIVIDD